jgi:predicted DNA-binding transcriptional regulator AlpA
MSRTGVSRQSTGADFFDELVDRPTAAHLLSVSPRTLDRWHLLREGPPRCLLGGKVRYRLAAIEEWVRQCEVTEPRNDAIGRSGHRR